MKPCALPKVHYIWRSYRSGKVLTNRIATGHTLDPTIEGNGRFIDEKLVTRIIEHYEWILAIWLDHDTSVKYETCALLAAMTEEK